MTVVSALSLAAWLWLLLAQGFFWRTDVRLPDRADPDVWPPVCVVVPARDEAGVLPASLPSLLAQDYPGRAEVFLIDDGSTDGTGDLARDLAGRRDGLALTVASPGSRRRAGRASSGRCGTASTWHARASPSTCC